MSLVNRLNSLRERKEQGFTLIELLVVIVIIGVLAAIALPIFFNQQKTAADAALKSDLKLVANSMMVWSAQGNNFVNAPYVDEEFQYVIKYNNGMLNAWPTVTNNRVKQLFPGMTDFNISDGSRVAVKITNDKGFCVAGAHDGGNFTGIGPSSRNDPNFLLYYDSVSGVITDRDGLDRANGGCSYFARS